MKPAGSSVNFRPIVFAVTAVLVVAAGVGAADQACIITNPLEGAVFPADMVAPHFRWADASQARRWSISVESPGQKTALTAEVDTQSWRPSPEQWNEIRTSAVGKPATFRLRGFPVDPAEGKIVSSASISFGVSIDPVGAPIFFREVPLPLNEALLRLPEIRWNLGSVSEREQPRTVLTHLPQCANCHSFSADGATLAMDLDYGNDKGSYVIAPVSRKIVLETAHLVTWRDFRPERDFRTLGLLSRLSPDGRYALSTVEETTVHRGLPELDRPQLFFPVRGIIALFDRVSQTFGALRGADDPAFVNTNPAWSPDGSQIVFCRARALEVQSVDGKPPRVPLEVVEQFVSGERRFRFDLHRVDFNQGRGGEPRPLPGASDNGRSNYFPTYSPDGRWIVFCQADSFMLNQLHSALYIMPSSGGTPRRMNCNFDGRMNSWHSFSPNGRWLVFASKATGPYTRLWLTHIDDKGEDTVPVLLEGFAAADRAANIPEFVNIGPGELLTIEAGFRAGRAYLDKKP